MLRTRQFDQRPADGDRPRHWVLISRPPRRKPVSVAPFARCAPRDNSKPHPTDDLRLLSPKTRHATELQRRRHSPRPTASPPCRKIQLLPCLPIMNWRTWQTWQTRKNQPLLIPAHFITAKKHPKNPSLPLLPLTSDCHRQRMERGLTRMRRIFTDQEEATSFRCQPPWSAAHPIRVHPPNPCKSASYSSFFANRAAGRCPAATKPC